MSTQTPTVSAIIVSYNTREMTLDCLRALHADLGEMSAEVFVVDNASTDGSPAAIRSAFPQTVVIENKDNRGFGGANNQALAMARGEFLLLINSDAFAEEGATLAMIELLRRRPAVAVAGPRLLNGDGSLQVSCHPFPSPVRAWLENLCVSWVWSSNDKIGDYRRWAHDSERVVDFVSGACMLVRRTAFEQVGGFDDRFFMYSEETDWQRRFRAAGWLVVFTPEARVKHFGGASGASERAAVNKAFLRSLDYYQVKHHGIRGLISFRAAMVVGSMARAALWAGIVIASPARRATAWAKTRKYAFLTVRQAAYWPLHVTPPARRAAS